MSNLEIIKKSIKIYILLIVLTSVSACKNIDVPEFNAPDITIISCKVLSENTCLIKVNVKKGIGANLKGLHFEFDDITDTASQTYKPYFQIQLKNEYVDSFQLKIPTDRHDYTVKAILNSDKNIYTSSPILIRFSSAYQNSVTGIDYIDLFKSEYKDFYIDTDNNIGNALNRGDYFLVLIHYSKTLTSSADYILKLNGTIPLSTDKSFNGSSDNTVSWGATIPANLPPGDYTVHLYTGGKEYIAYSKLRVLSGLLNTYSIPENPIYSPNYQELDAYFISGSKLFYIYRISTGTTVITYDLTTKTWNKKNSITYPEGYTQYTRVEPACFSYNNKEYVLLQYRNDALTIVKIRIMEYNEAADSWKIITDYPSVAHDDFSYFRIGDCLYMGGGNHYGDVFDHDLWEYNFPQNKWTKKKNIPGLINGVFIANCSSATEGYAFTNYREFWKYSPQDDSWTKLASLNGGPYTRYATTLLSGDNKVYLVGGATYENMDTGLDDVWEYSLSSNSWTLKYLSQTGIGAPTFYYNGKIIAAVKRTWDGKPYIDEIQP